MDQTLINYIYSVIIGGTASSLVTELAKLPVVPVAAKKFPRTTAAVLSFLSAVVALLVQGTLTIQHWSQLIATATGAFIISVMTFKSALKGLSTNS